MLLTLVVGRCLIIMVIERPARPLTQIIGELRGSMFIPRRIANALPILVAMLVFGGTFTVIKSSIPFFNPYSWDVAFEAWDRWLHGGTAPWLLLHPLLGKPIVTHCINMGLCGVVHRAVLHVGLAGFRPAGRAAAAPVSLTLLLCWIVLGNLAAISCHRRARATSANHWPRRSVRALHGLSRRVGKASPGMGLIAQDVLWSNYMAREVRSPPGSRRCRAFTWRSTTYFRWCAGERAVGLATSWRPMRSSSCWARFISAGTTP